MAISIDTRPRESLTAWLTEWLAGELGADAATIDPGKPFLSYGLNSIQAMMLAGDLETGLGRSLPPTLAWDHPCIADLADHLYGLAGPSPSNGLAAGHPEG